MRVFLKVSIIGCNVAANVRIDDDRMKRFQGASHSVGLGEKERCSTSRMVQKRKLDRAEARMESKDMSGF